MPDPVIFPNAYFPPIYWWSLALHHKNFLIENRETYPKQTYRNRCYIYSANGPMQLNIPVRKTMGNHTPISEIEIDHTKNWKLVHWRSIESSYSKTPYFLFYKDIFSRYFDYDHQFLHEYTFSIIQTCIVALKAKSIEPSFTTEYIKDPNDLREMLNPKIAPRQLGFRTFPRYIQPFEERHGFIENLSILDLLFNLGPDAQNYLEMLYKVNFNELNVT
ncbi:MAG: WbqC family protein [Bacteroidetes bacterium]|nr:WbqC family protein [Bacteroidota bacterium]